MTCDNVGARLDQGIECWLVSPLPAGAGPGLYPICTESRDNLGQEAASCLQLTVVATAWNQSSWTHVADNAGTAR